LTNTIATGFLYLLLAFSVLHGKYPADSLLQNEENILVKGALLPVAVWQRFSYNCPLIDCPHSPSCSHYTAQAVSETGIIKGTILGIDRIIRCNPAILYYVHRDSAMDNGRYTDFILNGEKVNDPVNLAMPVFPLFQLRKLSPEARQAVSLSAIYPGLGRIRSGYAINGLFSALFFSAALYMSTKSYENKQPGRLALGSAVALAVYFGDGYGVNRELYHSNRIHLNDH
jgi:putative component of membrane protein insertase Oxa1/YidC/SpoIIIJ protein YidD